MAALLPQCGCGGSFRWKVTEFHRPGTLHSFDHSRMRPRKNARGGSRALVLASKSKSRRKNVVDDDHVSGYTAAALPLLEEYAASVAVMEKKKTNSSSGTMAMEGKVGSLFEGKAGLLDEDEASETNGTSRAPSLQEFLIGRVGSLDEEERDGSKREVSRTKIDKRRKSRASAVSKDRARAMEDAEDEEQEPKQDERVEVWKGDSNPMTAEEERELLAQAEMELAELKKLHGDEHNDDGDDRVEVWKGDRVEVWNEDDPERDDQSKNKKGVPAVMRCFDRAKIYVKAGDGGNGEVAFRREKYIPHGGPSGGNGGRGGNVYIEVDPSLNSLLCFRKSVHFRAGRGGHGLGKSQDGAFGSDCVVKVPPGTVVKDVKDSATLLLEMTQGGQRELLMPGGRGGRGNAAFKSAKNKTPQLAERGEQGAEMWIDLELKLVADVGIIGVPNAGKSTLLSAISAARPTIAAYPFTTLLPNLGVVSLDFDATMVVADLPGLLEGAHAGYELGHEFLRHTERCRVLIHVIDGTSPQPELEYDAVRLELELFDPQLCSKPSIVAFNKMDVTEAAEKWQSFQTAMESRGVIACSMSAATMEGTSQVVRQAYKLLRSVPIEELVPVATSNRVASMVKKERSSPIGEFKVEVDPEGDLWYIHGAGMERFTQMTNWEYFESLQRFERVLECSGINAELKAKGIHEGDKVVIGDIVFTWHDSNDIANVGNWRRGQRGSKNWPH